MAHFRTVWLMAAVAAGLLAQSPVRPKDVREVANAGSSALPRLTQFLHDPQTEVRAEAVKQIVEIGPPRSLDPLIEATRDNDAEVQILATDGIVNFYLPGYVKTGLGGTVRRMGTAVKGKFADTDDQVIDRFITPRPEAIAALGRLVSGGDGMYARANAARAVGVLRGTAATGQLVEALRSKDSTLIYESLIALQKIQDESAGPRVEFLLRDLDARVQMAAIDTVGLLRDQGALPGLTDVLDHASDIRVKRSALSSIAMLPAPSSRPIYQRYLHDKDDKLRASAAEGYGRLKDPADRPVLEAAWKDEPRINVRLSLAFALVNVGNTGLSEFSPLQFLIDNLNSAAYHGVAQPFLTEMARDAGVRQSLYAPLQTGTKDEKIGLAGVLGASGDQESLSQLKKLGDDPSPEVAQAALNALRNLQTRLGG